MYQILKQLEALEGKTMLNTVEYKTYKDVYNQLVKDGERPLWKKYDGRAFLKVNIDDLPQQFVPSSIRNSLSRNNVLTVRDILGISRIDIKEKFIGIGDGKWRDICALQQLIIDNIPPIEYHICKIIPQYTIGSPTAHTTNVQIPSAQVLVVQKASSQYEGQPIYSVLLNENHKEKLGSKVYTYCANNISRVIEVLDITEEEIGNAVGYGASAVDQLQKAKAYILSNKDALVEEYKLYETPHIVPTLSPDEEQLGLEKKVRIAMEQMQEWLHKLGEDELALDIKMFFLNPTTDEDVLAEVATQKAAGNKISEPKARALLMNKTREANGFKQLTYQRFDQKITEWREWLLNEKSVCDKADIKLATEIAYDLLNLKSDILYMSEQEAIAQIDEDADFNIQRSAAFQILGLKLTTSNPDNSTVRQDQAYVIPSGKEAVNITGMVANYLEYIHRALTKNADRSTNVINEVRPMSLEEIQETIAEYFPKVEIEDCIFERLLDSYSRVECVTEDNITKYQLKYEKMTSSGRFARIIYNQKRIDKNNAPTIDLQKDPNNKVAHERFVNYIQGRAHDVLNDFDWIARDNGIFSVITGSTTQKTYSVREAVASYVKAQKERLFTLQDVCAHLAEIHYPQRTDGVIRKYILDVSAENEDVKGQFCSNDYLQAHAGIHWAEKGETKHKPYINEMKAFILSRLEDLEGSMITQAEMMHLCEPIYRDHASYNVFYPVLNELQDRVEKIVMEDATYLKLKEPKLSVAEVLETATTEENVSVTIAAEPESIKTLAPVVMPQSQRPTSFVDNTDWGGLEKAMREQLQTYDYVFMDYSGAIQKFVHFIRYEVKNPDLKKYLPHLLRRFWKEPTNEFDLYDIITHVSTDYEGLVREIYSANCGQEMPATKGMREVVSYVQELDEWQRNNWNSTSKTEPAIKYYKNLYNIRNKRSHTEPLKLTILQYYQRISEFLVLSIFTVDRFLQ